MLVPTNATSVRTPIEVVDSAGNAATGLTHASAITFEYRRPADSSWQSVTLVAGGTSYTSGGFRELGDGVYEICWPNAAIVADESTAIRYTYDGAKHADHLEARLPATTTGVHLITVTIQRDTDSAPVSGAIVSIVGTAIKATTGTSGVVSLPVDDGSYTVRVSPPTGYDPVADTAVTVSGGDESETIQLSPQVIAVPLATDVCVVVVDVIDQQGGPVAGVHVTPVKEGDPAFANDAVIQHADSEYVTDAAGRATFPLIRGNEFHTGTNAVYKITLSYEGRSKSFSFTVPDAATAVATAETP